MSFLIIMAGEIAVNFGSSVCSKCAAGRYQPDSGEDECFVNLFACPLSHSMWCSLAYLDATLMRKELVPAWIVRLAQVSHNPPRIIAIPVRVAHSATTVACFSAS